MSFWWERHPRLVDSAVVGFWALLVGGSLLLTLMAQRQDVDRVAYDRARVLFDVIETTRLWNARHGGLYAPVSDHTPPNPYLVDAQRDVMIGGVPYTRINPSYMTRQISEIVRARQGVWFTITSLKPLNPGNAPDPWEAQALQRLEAGERDILELTREPSGERFRFIAPLHVREECMDCHAIQNYKVGDVRGGLSVSLPAETVFADFAMHRAQMIGLHGVAFVLLAGGTLIFLSHLRRNWSLLAAAKAEQEAMVVRRTAELQTANLALKRSNEELESFAYAISHDLQEPLRMVSGYGGILKRRYGETLDAEGTEFIDYMVDGAGRMRGMINDLLAYSRVDQQALDARPVALASACDKALGNLGAAIEDAGAEVSVDLAGIKVLGDASQIARLLQNLIGNAIKYAHPDRPPRIAVTATARDDGLAAVAVGDNGLGIPPEARERVFRLFQRLRQNDSPGTGMGLALARRIVERHGGSIEVEDSTPGVGTVMRFTLPLAPAVAQKEHAEEGA